MGYPTTGHQKSQALQNILAFVACKFWQSWNRWVVDNEEADPLAITVADLVGALVCSDNDKYLQRASLHHFFIHC